MVTKLDVLKALKSFPGHPATWYAYHLRCSPGYIRATLRRMKVTTKGMNGFYLGDIVRTVGGREDNLYEIIYSPPSRRDKKNALYSCQNLKDQSFIMLVATHDLILVERPSR